MYHRCVFDHAIGCDAANDPLMFGQGRHLEDWPSVALSNDGRWLSIVISQGWTKSEVFLKDIQSDAPPHEVVTGKDFLYTAEPYNGYLYIVTNEDAPRSRVFKAPVATPAREHWREIIPQSEAVLAELQIIGGQILVKYERKAHSQLQRFTLEGEVLGEIKLPTLGTVSYVAGEADGSTAFYLFQSFTLPTTVYRFNLASCESTVWDTVETGFDSNQYETQQVWYTSKDGTRVPMFLIMRKGLAATGTNPTLLTAYGGFNVSLTPEFAKTIFPWLERGGIFAVANVRGGSEFGEDWHRAGMLANKQNAFDDFYAAAEFLQSEGYTDRGHLAFAAAVTEDC